MFDLGRHWPFTGWLQVCRGKRDSLDVDGMPSRSHRATGAVVLRSAIVHDMAGMGWFAGDHS